MKPFTWDDPIHRNEGHVSQSGITSEGVTIHITSLSGYRTTVSLESADGTRGVADYLPTPSSAHEALEAAHELASNLLTQNKEILVGTKPGEKLPGSIDSTLDVLQSTKKVHKDAVGEFVAQGGWDGPWKAKPSQGKSAVKQTSVNGKPATPAASPKDDLKAILASTSNRSSIQHSPAPAKGR